MNSHWKNSIDDNSIPFVGERERVADKLDELEHSNELVVSSIRRASLLLGCFLLEVRSKLFQAGYHHRSSLTLLEPSGKDYALRRLGGEKDSKTSREFRGNEKIRSSHRNRVPTYIAQVNKLVTRGLCSVERFKEFLAGRNYIQEVNFDLLYHLRGGTLKLAATVFMQLPYPEKLSPEYLDLAASVVRAYQNYLKLLSWARYNARELVQRGIKVEGLNLAEIEIRTRGEHGRRVLALYERGKNAGVEGQKYHILFWRLELVILAVSPFVEMPRFSKYGSLIDDRGIRERLLRLQHRRNEYLPYVWKELTDGNIEIYHQKIQSKIQELKNALEPMAIEDLQSILNVDSEDAVSGRYGLSTEVITMFQQMPPDNVRPEYLELAAVYHSYYSQLLECAQKVGYDEFWQRWGDQNALWSEYYSAAVRARDRDLQEDLEAYFENWGLPEDTAGDDGNNQVSMEAAPVDPLEHSVGAHWGSHYADLPGSSRGVDTTWSLGGINYERSPSSTSSSHSSSSNFPERQESEE
ncbi:hypothetical protein SeLEV6574_g07605 [Synchytrium endobioticum]|uniref:Uncharacterized protein n=1 Tax=Synchytrium endobioticum TaxID=286115 RepID=A0A507CHN3_9FUNG|nr:hypothetical protein SeLEV6574_g07605 [Synchytrium endobioticum]